MSSRNPATARTVCVDWNAAALGQFVTAARSRRVELSRALASPAVRRPLGALLALSGVVACVPPDEAPSTGSVAFTLGASRRTREGIGRTEADGYEVTFDRILLGFKTMTVGRIGTDDACAFRGRGARSDVVVDPREGVTQTFNGLIEEECPDVGLILGPPGGATGLAGTARAADLVELASGSPAHAVIEATARRAAPAGILSEPVKIALRFDTARTGTRFGGCRREAGRGVRVVPGARAARQILFAAENLFRDAISTESALRVRPLLAADARGDNDGVVTIADLDAVPLTSIDVGTYQMPDGTRQGTLGAFLRVLFRFSLLYEDESGICVGNEPDP